MADVTCPVCGGSCGLLDTVDFSKNCEERRGVFLPKTGIAVEYYDCDDCDFCFAPSIMQWTQAEFRSRIYNDGYPQIDPDYLEARPRLHADRMHRAFGHRVQGIRHLDYGGGNGLMAKLLREAGWNSTSYDPFADPDKKLAELGRFEFVSAFEVFEHVPDVHALMALMKSLIKEDGVVFFSTLLTDGNIAPGGPLSWWYAAPRNGHISLYSRRSLEALAASAGFNFGSYAENYHALWRAVPRWADGVLPIGL